MKESQIERVTDRRERNDTTESEGIPLIGDADIDPWTKANILTVDTYPWDSDGAEISATVRILYDPAALYVQYQVTDHEKLATERALNGEVWKDSCVELFVSPHSDRHHYINFEANCLGDFLVGYGRGRDDRRLITPEAAAAIRVSTSVSGIGSTREANTRAESWWLAAAIPFTSIGTLVDKHDSDVTPDPGTVWRANVYCCRGDPAPQYSAWNPISTSEPEFHSPDDFGRFRFR